MEASLLTQRLLSGGLAVFLAELLVTVCRRPSMFWQKSGRRHRAAGIIYLGWLVLGAADACAGAAPLLLPRVAYDGVLGTLGCVLTLTAASDFASHSSVVNDGSGTLDETATVTVSEMEEHR